MISVCSCCVVGLGNAGVTEKNRTDELTKGAGKMDGLTIRLKRVRSDLREEMTLKIMQISGHPLHTRLGNMVSEHSGWLSPVRMLSLLNHKQLGSKINNLNCISRTF